MVDKGLRLARAFRDAEDVQEELFDEAEVRVGVEGGVEGEDGPGAFEAVACEVELFHRVHCTHPLLTLIDRPVCLSGDLIGSKRTVLHVHFDRRPIGRFAHPEV